MGTPQFIREQPDVYRSKRSQYLTSHQLIDFRKCPMLFRKKQAGIVPEVIGEHYTLGAAAHCLTLEGREEFQRQYVVGAPINPKTERSFGRYTKAYAEWEALQGKPCLSDEQHALCCQLASSVKAHKEAASLLAVGEAEGVLRAIYGQTQCQIRVDWFNPYRGLIDLKTCDNLDHFERDCRQYHYVTQMAFYSSIIYRCSQLLPDVHLIAVEKREPFRVGVWNISRHDLLEEMVCNSSAIRDLRRCIETTYWPSKFEQTRTLPPACRPGYADIEELGHIPA